MKLIRFLKTQTVNKGDGVPPETYIEGQSYWMHDDSAAYWSANADVEEMPEGTPAANEKPAPRRASRLRTKRADQVGRLFHVLLDGEVITANPLGGREAERLIADYITGRRRFPDELLESTAIVTSGVDLGAGDDVGVRSRVNGGAMEVFDEASGGWKPIGPVGERGGPGLAGGIDPGVGEMKLGDGGLTSTKPLTLDENGGPLPGPDAVDVKNPRTGEIEVIEPGVPGVSAEKRLDETPPSQNGDEAGKEARTGAISDADLTATSGGRGYTVRHAGRGRWHVYNITGERVTDDSLEKDAAERRAAELNSTPAA